MSRLLSSQTSVSPGGNNGNDNDTQLPAKKETAGKSVAKKDPTPSKLYKDTIKEVDKVFNALVKRYNKSLTRWSGVTADDFARSMEAKFLPTVKSLSETSPAASFNLLLDIGEHAYGDLDAWPKACGYGETKEPYENMDDLLIEIINARREADGADTDGAIEDRAAAVISATEPYVVEPSYADLGGEESAVRSLWGKKRANMQLMKKLERARLADLKTMFNTRRERRGVAKDWAGNALNDLVETGGRIDQYGIGEHFFQKSIGLLASIKGVERPALARPPRKLEIIDQGGFGIPTPQGGRLQFLSIFAHVALLLRNLACMESFLRL
ncbi:hypothetical protein Hte_001276 [Hypoxylon texense]